MTLPLILLPGLLCDDALWAHQIAHLGDVCEPMVADLTGQDSMAGLARAVLDAAPPRFALAGLSMGGYVAMEIMRQAPARVTQLALLDTTARPDTPEGTERRWGFMRMAELGEFKGVTPRLLPGLIHPSRLEDPVAGIVLAMAERVGKDAFLRQQTAIMNRVDSRPDMPGFRCSTLILGGRQDALTPPEVLEEMAGLIPHAKYELIDESGHLTPVERPEAVTKALRHWLTADVWPS